MRVCAWIYQVSKLFGVSVFLTCFPNIMYVWSIVPLVSGYILGSEAGTSSGNSSNSGKKNLRADEDYELAIARAKHISLGQTPLPDITAFQESDDLILYSPNGVCSFTSISLSPLHYFTSTPRKTTILLPSSY